MEEATLYVCSECEKEFEDWDNCDEHTRDCRGVPPILDIKKLRCPLCDELFDEDEDKEILKEHEEECKLVYGTDKERKA